MPLHLVPQTPPTPDQAARERVKATPNPRSELQCPRCGCRTYLTERNGAAEQGGRLVHGAKLDEWLCADCYCRGVRQSLKPEPPTAA